MLFFFKGFVYERNYRDHKTTCPALLSATYQTKYSFNK